MSLRKIIDDIIVGGIIGEERSLTANIGYQLSDVKRTWNVNLAGGALRDVVRYLLSFAKMVFKTQIADVKATALFKAGVDAVDTICFLFENAKMASMQCSIVDAQNR